MELPYASDQVAAAGHRFDSVIAKIQAGQFQVDNVPERKVCKECDLKALCATQGLIQPFPKE